MVMGEAGIGVSMRPVPGYGVNEDIRVFHGLPHSHRCFGGYCRKNTSRFSTSNEVEKEEERPPQKD